MQGSGDKIVQTFSVDMNIKSNFIYPHTGIYLKKLQLTCTIYLVYLDSHYITSYCSVCTRRFDENNKNRNKKL